MVLVSFITVLIVVYYSINSMIVYYTLLGIYDVARYLAVHASFTNTHEIFEWLLGVGVMFKLKYSSSSRGTLNFRVLVLVIIGPPVNRRGLRARGVHFSVVAPVEGTGGWPNPGSGTFTIL